MTEDSIASPQRETLHETGGSFHPQFCKAAKLRFAYSGSKNGRYSRNVMRNTFLIFIKNILKDIYKIVLIFYKIIGEYYGSNG
jgi:hypothetical protein